MFNSFDYVNENYREAKNQKKKDSIFPNFLLIKGVITLVASVLIFQYLFLKHTCETSGFTINKSH